MMMSRRDHGLTLIELTVGVAVMTGIIASAYFCLHAGFTSQRALDEHMDQTQKARVVLAMMTKDLRHACAWNQDFTFVGMDRKLGNIEADNVDFATHNWRPGPRARATSAKSATSSTRTGRRGKSASGDGVTPRPTTNRSPEETRRSSSQESFHCASSTTTACGGTTVGDASILDGSRRRNRPDLRYRPNLRNREENP